MGAQNGNHHPLVGIVMGSSSDWPTMKEATEVLRTFEIPFEAHVLSAHRTPDRMAEYAEEAHERGIKVIIAGAGGAAHLPGMVAAYTPLPVIGVPIPSRHLNGLDSLLSIVQMPGGVPVATVAIGAAQNAALLAVQILATSDPRLLKKVEAHKTYLRDRVTDMDEELQQALKEEATGDQ